MIKKTFYDFCVQVMIVFAFMILALNIFCLALGTTAKEYSSLFSLAGQGIPADTVFQFLAASIGIVGVKYLFIADFILKKMSYQLRILCMLALIFVMIVIFAVLFHWFPIGQGRSWLLFLVCYGVSAAGSFLLSSLRIKIENKRLENALEQIKKEKNKKEDLRS